MDSFSLIMDSPLGMGVAPTAAKIWSVQDNEPAGSWRYKTTLQLLRFHMAPSKSW